MVILGVNEAVEKELIETAVKNEIEKLMIFGSRARGDYHRTSDIDLAVSGGNISAFSADIEEYVPTLLEFDIVNLDGSVQEDLRESIRKEGKLLYEKI